MWPFTRKPLLDAETAAWHFENFEWLTKAYGASQSLANAQLVLPLPGYFNTDGEKGHALAMRVFEQVKAYCQIPHWPAELVADSAIPEPGRTLFEVTTAGAPLGTFGGDARGGIRISYQPNLLANPPQLIATFAHEIGHYVVAAAPIPPVCEEDELECLTDLAAVYLGFGVFLANGKFVHEQWRDEALGTQGWQMRRAGYLPEADLIFATAIFIRAKALDSTPAVKALKPHLGKMLMRALGDLDRHYGPQVAAIRAIEGGAAEEEARTG